jgi:hypothetical protein
VPLAQLFSHLGLVIVAHVGRVESVGSVAWPRLEKACCGRKLRIASFASRQARLLLCFQYADPATGGI